MDGGCHCKYSWLTRKLFVLTQQNPSAFLFLKLLFVGLRGQLLNVYGFSVLSAIRGRPLDLHYYSAICIMVLSDG